MDEKVIKKKIIELTEDEMATLALALGTLYMGFREQELGGVELNQPTRKLLGKVGDLIEKFYIFLHPPKGGDNGTHFPPKGALARVITSVPATCSFPMDHI